MFADTEHVFAADAMLLWLLKECVEHAANLVYSR